MKGHRRFFDALMENLYHISSGRNRSILYAPLQGVALSVNKAYVAALRSALAGDEAACRAVGCDEDAIKGLIARSPIAGAVRQPSEVKPGAPSSITLFLTQGCTLMCRYCYCSGGAGTTMPLWLAQASIDLALEAAKAAGKRTFCLNIHGGDVGACWELFVTVVGHLRERCREAGLESRVNLGTNACYSAEQAEYIARNVTDATVSLDGTPSVHDRYRVLANGEPSSPQVLETIALFDRFSFPYSIRMTVLADTVDSLPESVKFICKHSQAIRLRAEPLYVRGRAVDGDLAPPSPRRFVEKYRRADEIARRRGRQLSYSGARLGKITTTFCSYATPTLGVTPDGMITSCYEVLQRADPLAGSFFYGRVEQDGRGFVLDEAAIAQIRRDADRRRDHCRGCFCYWHCAGDCAAKDDLSRPGGTAPARCEITRALTKNQILAALEAGMPFGQDVDNCVENCDDDLRRR